MKIGWVTDLHFDHCRRNEVVLQKFLRTLRAADLSGLIITGDISNGHALCSDLRILTEVLPVYVVVGNHDLYGRYRHEVLSDLEHLTRKSSNLTWLHQHGMVLLRDGMALIGVDNWCDGRSGDYRGSTVSIADNFMIRDLIGKTKDERLAIMQQWADGATSRLFELLASAVDADVRRLILACHVPPFAQSAVHLGAMSGPDFQPYFCNLRMGEMLLDFTQGHPEIEIDVICGHSHSDGYYEPATNMVVLTGGAEYGDPQLKGIFHLDEINPYKVQILATGRVAMGRCSKEKTYIWSTRRR
jgi:calcineurin-like phosphoesterase family protein